MLIVNLLRAFLFAFVVALPLLAGGCSDNGADEARAQREATELMNALKAQDIDAALALYSEEFYKLTPREQWREKLQTLQQEYGPMDRYLLRQKQADTRFSGKFYIFEYETVHEKGRLEHLISFVWPVDGKDLILVAHRITPR
jgi:hypothetical protein